MIKRDEFRFMDRLRVRWAEIDAQKIVFNGHYLMYFDTAIAGYWRALGVPYAQTMEQLGGDMFVRKATLEYFGPAVYDDLLDIGVRCARIGNSSMRFVGAAFRRDELLVSCELVYVFADPHAHMSKPVPTAFRDLLQSYEAGRPMIDVRVGSWEELEPDARAIRTEVFVDEQKIPAEMEWDEADRNAVHALARNRLGMALATGRLAQPAPGVAKIGRMAVRQSARGSGVGRAVLDALARVAKERGDREVVLNAQVSAAAFYTRAGFSARGPLFDEAGLPHVEMARSL
jgi:YbgC/YbaW family acyl-CoA thioester hydrolase